MSGGEFFASCASDRAEFGWERSVWPIKDKHPRPTSVEELPCITLTHFKYSRTRE